jgi:hypothetical protein
MFGIRQADASIVDGISEAHRDPIQSTGRV